MPSRFRFTVCLTTVAGLALFAACKSPQNLPNATIPNQSDTVTLYALSGTAPGTPSGYALIGPAGPLVVYTERSFTFDFAFDIDSQPKLLPSGTFPTLPNVAGLQKSSAASFFALREAPLDGYVIDQPLVIGPGMLILVRSATQICADGTNHSLYGKMQILEIDYVARTLQFEVMVDRNCGYLNLTPGIPTI